MCLLVAAWSYTYYSFNRKSAPVWRSFSSSSFPSSLSFLVLCCCCYFFVVVAVVVLVVFFRRTLWLRFLLLLLLFCISLTCLFYKSADTFDFSIRDHKSQADIKRYSDLNRCVYACVRVRVGVCVCMSERKTGKKETNNNNNNRNE